MCKDRNKHKTACFFTRDTANTNLLISWTWSHDACIVRVSDKTLFILRERISQARDGFQITTWHCRIHRLMCSPSNSQSRSRHRETDEQTAEKRTGKKQGTTSACTALQKTHRQQRENKTTPLCRFRTPTEDVFARQQKTVYLKTGTKRETVATQGRAWFRQFMFAVALRMHSKLVSSDAHSVSSN